MPAPASSAPNGGETTASSDSADSVSIRFCVILPCTPLDDWKLSTVRQLLAHGSTEPVAFILESGSRGDRGPDAPAGSPQPWPARGGGGEECAHESLSSLASARRVPRWPLHSDDHSAGEPAAALVQRLRTAGVDFVLDLRDGPFDVRLAEAARFGVWRFEHADEDPSAAGSRFWWTAWDGEPVIGTRLLLVAAGESAPSVLREGFVPLLRYAFASSVRSLLQESARWPAQACTDIANGVLSRERVTIMPERHARGRPHLGQRLAFHLRGIAHLVRGASAKLFLHDHWRVGVIDARIDAVMRNPTAVAPTWLPWRPRGEFYADPFGVVRDGKLTILCETLDYATNRGAIAHTSTTAEEDAPLGRVDIGPEVHRSYPFLLEHAGELYCVPETYRAKEVAIYRASAFPTTWEKVATLISGLPLLDATLFRHEERWWLACTNQVQGQNLNLHLWHANQLLGPWHPHAVNPVKTDPRSSRPAGTPFWSDGVLYRPAQDCSRTYGGGIMINRVTTLTPTEFREEVAAVIEPGTFGAGLTGAHTLSAAGNWTLIDAKRPRFAFSAFRRSIRASWWLVKRAVLAPRVQRADTTAAAPACAVVGDEAR